MARPQLRGTLEYDRGRKAFGASISDELAKLGPPDGMSVTMSAVCGARGTVTCVGCGGLREGGLGPGCRCWSTVPVTVPSYYDPVRFLTTSFIRCNTNNNKEASRLQDIHIYFA